MPFSSQTRVVNPRLGSHFSIFVSAVAALVVVLIILEQLGVNDATLRLAMLGGPLMLYLLIGVRSISFDSYDYFTGGRRVPAFFNGLVLATTALGGTGFLILTGLFFIDGFDALCLVIGWCAGLVVMVTMIAPYLRKAGAYTLASYFAQRFDSNIVRMVCATLLVVPMLLLIAAELRIGGYLASWLLGSSELTAIVIIMAALSLPLIIGGMRALTWSGVAKSIVAILALLVPVTVLAALVTNLPLPQMSHGPVLRALGRQEVWQVFPQVFGSPLAFDLAGQEMAHITKRYATPFASVGPWSFVLMSFVIMAGIASSPSLLLRSGTTPSVYHTRKSIGWAVVILGIAVLTMSSVAVFMRDLLMDQIVGARPDQLPAWFIQLTQMGIASLADRPDKILASAIGFKRDGVLLALPIAAGFPLVVVYLAIAGALAGAMVAASAALFAYGTSLSEDIIFGLRSEPAKGHLRLAVARSAMLISVILGGITAIFLTVDPLDLFLWSLVLSGATIFPTLVLSIWWKRINKWGVMAGMIAGFIVTMFMIFGGGAAVLEINPVLAGIFGIPVSFMATVLVTHLTPLPSRSNLSHVRDIRVPGGETMYDREMRLLRARSRARGTQDI